MSELRVATVSDEAGTGPANLTKQWAAKAFVSYDATVPSILDSGNTSSLTDNGTGDFTQNFANAMPAATYGSQLSCGEIAVVYTWIRTPANAAPTTSALRVETRANSAAVIDRPYNMLTVTR